MLNEECITQVEPLCYLILLLDSLGFEINSVKVSEFWTQSLQQKELSTELMELLVFFWKKSRQKVEFNSLTFINSVFTETEKPIEFQQANHDGNRVEILEPEQIEATKEKPGVKEDHPPEVAVNSIILNEKAAGKSQESVIAPMISLVQPEDFNLSGRYIYGIVFGTDDFQTAGIDANPVYTILYRDIGALVHSCYPKAYESQDREQVENWLRQHQKVLDEALNHTNSLVPMSFDVIIDGSSSADPDNILKQWLEERYNPIKDLLEQLSGRAEYGIKIYSSVAMLTEKVTKENPDIIELSNRLASMSKGTAYLFQSELSQKIRKAVDEECRVLATEINAKIRQIVIDLKENKLEPEISDHQKAILNLAVLAEPEKVEALGDLLENLHAQNQYKVVFTGPWPAYSFVKDLG
jgi:hypothetical protein